MKLLIASDIHGALPAAERVVQLFDQHRCDLLCLLGDLLNYGPRNGVPQGLDAPGIAALLNRHAGHIIAVRGNCDSEVDQMLLRFPIMADYALVVDEGKRLFLTHGHIYNKAKMPKGKFDAIFTGHTHLWHLVREDGTVYCNTGSITFPKGGNVPTMAIYENGRITMYQLDGTKLQSLTL